MVSSAGIKVTVKGDVKKLTRHLTKVQRKIIPAVTTQSVNEVTRVGRMEAIKDTARQMKLPTKFIRKQFYKQGNTTTDRIIYKRMTRGRKTALLRVWHSGVPVYAIAGAQTKKGVKAKGGRLFKGAFKQHGLVHRRTSDKRYPIEITHVPIQRRLNREVAKRVSGNAGHVRFRAVFVKRLKARLARAQA